MLLVNNFCDQTVLNNSLGMLRFLLLSVGLSISLNLPAADLNGADIGAALEAEEATSMAKKLSNPVADLIAVPIQYNFNRGMGADSNGRSQNLVIQPVYPVNLPGGDNLIIRPILTAYSLNNVNGLNGIGMGNVQIETFYSPKPTSSLIWGIGPYLSLPSGSQGRYGSEQTGVGITGVGLTQLGPWTIGLLFVRSWAAGGTAEYGTANNFYYQPFASYTTSSNWTFGLDTESTFNFDVRKSSNQINASISKLVMIGNQAISLSFGPRYSANAIPGGPQGWGARAGVTFIFSK